MKRRLRIIKKKKLQNSWDSVRVIEGIMKFDNPHSEGMTIIPISVYRHQSMLDYEPKDYVHGERLLYTESWATRESCILERQIRTQKPRQKIGEVHSMIFLVPFYNPHDLFPSHFYETIRQRFRDRAQLWGQESFRTRGLSTIRRYYSDWAEAILLKHSNTLAKIGLYDAIEVTSQHFYKETTVLKGFIEHWSPTTNSFHLPYGEMSITFWDLHRIAGLPMVGRFYDEFIPTNRELAFVSSPDRQPSISETTIELFKEMGKFSNIHKLSPLQWLAHFSRGLR